MGRSSQLFTRRSIETGLIALIRNSYGEERFSQEKMSKDKQEQIR